MAEFCLECWNKINGTNESERKYILSKHLDLCEECGEWKPIVIMERKAFYMRIFKCVALPIRIIYIVIYIIWRLLLLPYFILKTKLPLHPRRAYKKRNMGRKERENYIHK